MEAMDRWVGEKLRELEEAGLADNTIVLYYSDHAGILGRSKRYLYESGLRVQLIVRFTEKYAHLAPGKPGTRNERVVSFIDFPPSIRSLTGMDVPQNIPGEAIPGGRKTPH